MQFNRFRTCYTRPVIICQLYQRYNRLYSELCKSILIFCNHAFVKNVINEIESYVRVLVLTFQSNFNDIN
jgi:hypothetical protein